MVHNEGPSPRCQHCEGGGTWTQSSQLLMDAHLTRKPARAPCSRVLGSLCKPECRHRQGTSPVTHPACSLRPPDWTGHLGLGSLPAVLLSLPPRPNPASRPQGFWPGRQVSINSEGEVCVWRLGVTWREEMGSQTMVPGPKGETQGPKLTGSTVKRHPQVQGGNWPSWD